MNEFNKIPAQLLLQDRSVTYSGYLDRKVMKLTFKHWIKNYVIISDGNLYIYSSNISSKPSLVCILSAFHQINIVKDRQVPPFWVFHLIPLIDNVPIIKLAAASQREMSVWITNLRAGVIKSKNKQLNRHNNDIDSGDTTSIYSNVSEKENVKNNLKIRNQSSIYEETEEILVNISSGNTEPTAPPIDFRLYPDLDNVIDISEDNSKLYKAPSTESMIFIGSREEAYKQLTRCKLVGTYLIRVDGDRQILTVICQGNVVKFCVISDSNVPNRICLAGQHESFNSIDQLIHYYHNNSLPNQTVKLTAPYTLIDKM